MARVYADPSKRHSVSNGGYGFFTWTENSIAANTVSANGWGGQRIIWSNDPNNARMVVVFSRSETWMEELHEVARDWMRLPPTQAVRSASPNQADGPPQTDRDLRTEELLREMADGRK